MLEIRPLGSFHQKTHVSERKLNSDLVCPFRVTACLQCWDWTPDLHTERGPCPLFFYFGWSCWVTKLPGRIEVLLPRPLRTQEVQAGAAPPAWSLRLLQSGSLFFPQFPTDGFALPSSPRVRGPCYICSCAICNSLNLGPCWLATRPAHVPFRLCGFPCGDLLASL